MEVKEVFNMDETIDISCPDTIIEEGVKTTHETHDELTNGKGDDEDG